MEAELTPEGNLRISVSDNERLQLIELKEEDICAFDSDAFMYDLFEGLIANSEYQWINPYIVGALTSAPILGILNEDDTVQAAYGFMDYQIESVQERLLTNGSALFTGA